MSTYPHCAHCTDCEDSAVHDDPCDAPACPGGQPIGGTE